MAGGHDPEGVGQAQPLADRGETPVAGADLENVQSEARGRQPVDAVADQSDEALVERPVGEVGAADAVIDLVVVVRLLQPVRRGRRLPWPVQARAPSAAAWTWASIQG